LSSGLYKSPLRIVTADLLAMVCIIFIVHTMHDSRVYLKNWFPALLQKTPTINTSKTETRIKGKLPGEADLLRQTSLARLLPLRIRLAAMLLGYSLFRLAGQTFMAAPTTRNSLSRGAPSRASVDMP
jgi:hypothetical protein